MAEMSPLRRRMMDDMTIRNLSPATRRSYLHAVSKFSQYFGRAPDRLGLEDVRAYQVHLASKGVAWGSLNQVVCALRFFYGVTLGMRNSVQTSAACLLNLVEPSSRRRPVLWSVAGNASWP
jgi:site-specific recombinase XerD